MTPAITILAVLDGFRALGLGVDRLRSEADVPSDLGHDSKPQPDLVLEKLWQGGFVEAGREEFAIEVGLALPLGVFGPIDYLAASADTVGGAFTSLTDHFASVAGTRSLEVDESDGEYAVTLLHREPREMAVCGDDFTVAVLIGRFRAVTAHFPLLAVELSRRRPARAARFGELLGAPVTFDHALAKLRFDLSIRDAALNSRDPLLRRALESMASQLRLGRSAPPFEMAIRSRLRDLLPTGGADASRIARSLGMSERTLHRRLAELGRPYQDVVDTFRRGEAERLLRGEGAAMAEIALSLGYADQSAFSRAFKRWAGMSPSDWLARAME